MSSILSDMRDTAPDASTVPQTSPAVDGDTYSSAEVDAAIGALVEPGRLDHAQEVVTHAAPALEHLLGAALHEGGWFGSAYDSEVSRAAAEPDQAERLRVVGTLVAEQTRLGMYVGVAVGFELARELQRQRERDEREQAPADRPAAVAPVGDTSTGHDTPSPNPETPNEE